RNIHDGTLRVAKIPRGVGRRHAEVVVLVGATGDLSRRKLLPGMFYLSSAGFIPNCRIIGVSLDQIDADGFRKIAREALDQFSSRTVKDADWAAFAETLDYVPIGAGADALEAAAAEAERKLGNENRRLHYLSVPPNAALSAVRLLAEADLVDHSRIIMEKPFGTDLKSAVALNAKLHEVFSEDQIFRIDHFLGKEPAQNILAFRFANGLFEPIWNRNFIDHVQIDVPETLGLVMRAAFLRRPGRIATWWLPTYSRFSRSWRWSHRRRWRRGPSARKRTRSFAACCRSTRSMSCAGNTRATVPRPASTPSPIPRPSSR